MMAGVSDARSGLTLARLDRCFDDPIPNWAERLAGSRASTDETHRVADSYDIAIDFMDMTNDLRLWARPADLRPGFRPSVGFRAVVGDEDAEPRVARIVAIDPDGNLELQVLPGSVESHRDLLARV